jgi:hypothetical protein
VGRNPADETVILPQEKLIDDDGDEERDDHHKQRCGDRDNISKYQFASELQQLPENIFYRTVVTHYFQIFFTDYS